MNAPSNTPLPLTLDSGVGPAARIGRAEADALVQTAVLRALGDRSPASVRPRARRGRVRAAAALVFGSVALSGVSGASYLAYKRFAAPEVLVETHHRRPRVGVPVRPAAPVVIPPAAVVDPLPVAPAQRAPVRSALDPDRLATASHLRAQGSWRKAHRAYSDLAAASPRDLDGMTAALAAASLELEHLKRPREALARYERLARAAAPVIAEEASWGVIECQRRLGDRAAEARGLRQFVARFPASLQRARAEARLAALDSGR